MSFDGQAVNDVDDLHKALLTVIGSGKRKVVIIRHSELMSLPCDVEWR